MRKRGHGNRPVGRKRVSQLENRKPFNLAQRSFRCIFALCVIGLPGCRSSQPPESVRPESGRQGTVSHVPPFETKEPERYQATRIITLSEWTSGGTPAPERIHKVLIARDGNLRREEYVDQGVQFVYLDTTGGRFVLLPSSNLYAEIKEDGPQLEYESSGISPNLLLNEQSSAVFENLGPETIEGQMTSKYRVASANSQDLPSGSETLIWINESIGMPVRSETISGNGESSAKVVMELKDIRLEVDKRLFELPSNYRKVETRLIWDKIYGAR